MSCWSNSAPPAPNYGQINRDTLQAQVDLAPQQYVAESSDTYGQPAYTRLALANLNTIMNGTGTTPGVNDLATKTVSQQRAADIRDVQNLGLRSHDAVLAANPETAALLAKLNAQANEGLDAGSLLTADQARQAQQASRAASAARGMGGGNQAISDELLRQFNMGQTLLRQRQAFAQSVIGNNQAVVGDPFMQILGRPANNIASAQQTQSQAGPGLFNPQAGMGLAQSNYGVNAQFAAAKPTTIQNVGSVAGIFGNVVGGVAAGMSM